MLDIDIDYTSLQQAISDLTSLKEELSSGIDLKYSESDLIRISNGDTCDVMNNIYKNMVNYQLELIKLTTLTESFVQNILEAFILEENRSAQANMNI